VTPEHVAVALIAFGDHTCRHAADRVGLSHAVVASRLRAFVVEPDHFNVFCIEHNVISLHGARRDRYPR
jgi:hypothetical protein